MKSCPNCGKPVAKGCHGPYCTGKCGMSVHMAMGTRLTEEQIKKLLSGSKVLLKGLRAKNGSTYDAYITLKVVKKPPVQKQCMYPGKGVKK